MNGRMSGNRGNDRACAPLSACRFLPACRFLRLPAALAHTLCRVPIPAICCALLLLICCTAVPAFAGDSCPEGGEHDYEVRLEKRATQTRDGLRRYTCLKCGRTYTERIPAMGHVWGAWKTVKKATCTADGRETRTCVKHQGLVHVQSRVVLAPGHDWSAWKTVRSASPGRAGLEKRVCRNNPKEVQYRQSPAFGASDGAVSGAVTGNLMISGSRSENASGSNDSGDVSDSARAKAKPGAKSGSGTAGGSSGSGASDSVGGTGASGTRKTVPFGAADAAILGANGAAVLFWTILLLPLVRVLFWAAAKRREKEEEESA